MSYLKVASAVVVAVLAIYGGMMLAQGAGHLYDDWQFVRASRIQALQRAAQQRQAAPKPATVSAAPAQ